MLGLTTEQYLWEGQGMAKLAAALDDGIAGTPTNFTEIIIFTDYASATAQNPQLLDHLDRYGWRVGKIDTPTPMSNDPDAAAKVFTINDMNWDALTAAVAEAPRTLNVEEGVLSHVIVTRSVFIEGNPLVGRIYVTGPRSSGYIEVDINGTVLAQF